MPRARDAVVGALSRKGFRPTDGGDHEFFIYWNLDGSKTLMRTKVSRGSSYKTLGDDLLGKMARQIGLPKKSFLELVDCTLDRPGYEKQALNKS
jgi:hypothetical protein